MPKTIKNEYYKYLTYDALMKAHKKSSKGKGYRKSKISIAKTKVELLNKSIIEIYGYDEIADYMYMNIEKNDVIGVEGKMRSDKVEVESVMEL